MLDKLLTQQNRTSTNKTYLGIWRQFNKFVINFDKKLPLWEERVMLFVAHLIERGMQSSSVKSCVSAIKKVLVNDSYDWDDNKIWLSSLTRACRIINDRVHTRLGISKNLLELILFEVERMFSKKGNIQPY